MALTAQEIIDYIGNSKKQTPVKVYLKGDLTKLTIPEGIEDYLGEKTGVIFGDWNVIADFLKNNEANISQYHLENDARNSAVPLADLKQYNARIEPGAIIRNQVTIGANAVIMMGAIINIGAVIGADTMIDMGAVLGGRATVGKHAHIGAGAVLAGVVEPASATPVIIEDDVLVGANAVVIEGVHVGKGAVVAAGAIVTEDVPENTVVAGVPAKVIKTIDGKTKGKTALQDALRNI